MTPRRTRVNFIGTGVTCVDNSANFRTNCTFTGGASGNSFETIDVPAGTDPVADGSTDTLTITETSFLTLTGTAATDTIDITQVTTDLGTDGLIAANAVALTTDTTGNYALGDAEAGAATTGDTATAFFSAGTIEHERGGLEADINAYDGLIGITGGATYNQTGTTTQIIIFDGAGAPTSAALSGQATMTNGGVVTVNDVTCTNCLTDTEVASADLATTVTTNANLTGEVTSVGNAATIADTVTVTGWVMGASTATTAAIDDSDTSLATTAFVNAEIDDDLDASSELLALVDDETGTGVLTFATAPTFTTQITITPLDAPTTDADGEIAVDTDGWGTNFDAIEFFNGTASAYLVATTASDAPSNGQVPKFNTGGSITWEADADSGGATAWSAIGDAAADADIAFLGFSETISGNTNDVTAIAQDLLSLNYTNDGATDILTQQVLVLNVVDSTGSTTTETLLRLQNSDTDEAVTDGIFFDAAGGAITDAIDAADPEIGTALRVDANDIVGTTGLINYTDFDVEADGDIVATDITLEGGDLLTGNIALRVGDATTDSVTITVDGTADGDFVAPATSIGAAEIVVDALTTTQMAATLTFADADLLDFGTNISATNEGILIPAHATTCASATSEGQLCWEEDADNLWIGDGAAAKQMNGGGADTNAEKEYWIPCLALYPIVADDSVPPLSKDAGTNIDQLVCAFDPSTDEARTGTFKVPSDVNTSGNATVRFYWYSSVNADASTDEVVWDFKYNAGTADGADPDAAGLTTVSVTATTATTAGQLDVSGPTAFSISGASWAANDLVYFVVSRDANNAVAPDDLEVDALLIGISIELPRA